MLVSSCFIWKVSVATFCRAKANIGDPDQASGNAAFDQCLHCLLTKCSIQIITYNGNGVVQMIIMLGNSIWLKRVNRCQFTRIFFSLSESMFFSSVITSSLRGSSSKNTI